MLASHDLIITLLVDGTDGASSDSILLTSKLLNADQLLQLWSASLSSKKLLPHNGSEPCDFAVDEFRLLTAELAAFGRDSLVETGVMNGTLGGSLLTAGVFTCFTELPLLRSISSFIVFLQQCIAKLISLGHSKTAHIVIIKDIIKQTSQKPQI